MGDTADLMSRVFKAWAKKDIVAFGACVASDFAHIVHVPTTISPLAGSCRGKQIALARIQAVADAFDILSYKVGPIMVSGDQTQAAAMVAARYRHVLSNVLLETDIGYFGTIRNGALTVLHEYHDMEKMESFAAEAMTSTPRVS